MRRKGWSLSAKAACFGDAASEGGRTANLSRARSRLTEKESSTRLNMYYGACTMMHGAVIKEEA